MVDPVISHIPDKDWHLDAYTLEKLNNFVQHKIGFSLSQSKVKDLKTFIARLITESSCTSCNQLFTLLKSSSPDADLIVDQLISFVTTGETYFFRIPSHFKVIREVLLPEMMKRHRDDRTLRIWSAGCSTGEEPYSLAILLKENLPELAQWKILIMATDICRDALSKGEKGVYSRWSFREVPMEIIRKNFIHKDEHYFIKENFKDMVTFKYLNLVEDEYPSIVTNTTAMDLILCRNVSIYFTPEVTKKVADKLYTSLTDGGFLLVGPAECSAEVYGDFVTRVFPDVIVYQKGDTMRAAPLKPVAEPVSLPNIRLRKHGAIKRPLLPAAMRPVQPFNALYLERRGGEKKETVVFDEAVRLMEEGQYSYSMEKFMEVVTINPDNARAYFLLARMSVLRGNRADAIRCLEKSLEKDPLLLEAYYFLALLKLEAGNVKEAATLFKKVIYIDQKFVLAYYHLGSVYKKEGNTVAAVKMFHNVRELLTGRSLDERIAGGEDIAVGHILTVTQ